jgi:hypothetical protein
MQDLPDTPEQRRQRRRLRRWKRRARILAPFLGLPLLLGALSLSVDLIEYRPTTKPELLADRVIKITRDEARQAITRPDLSATTQPNLPPPTAPDDVIDLDRDARDLDLTLSATPPTFRPPPRRHLPVRR